MFVGVGGGEGVEDFRRLVTNTLGKRIGDSAASLLLVELSERDLRKEFLNDSLRSMVAILGGLNCREVFGRI